MEFLFNTHRRSVFVVCYAAMAAVLIACGGSDDSDDTPPPPENSVVGTVMAPDGVTPIAGATVSIPEAISSLSAPVTASTWTLPCEAPVGSYAVATCTDADGRFTLDISQLARVTFPINMQKGSFAHSIEVDLAGASSVNLGGIALVTTSVKFAVVTGMYDRMEDILAKLGMGVLDSEHLLELGTEHFDLYDGAQSLDASYPEFITLFEVDAMTAREHIYAYDMVFINCGNDAQNTVLLDPDRRALLREYVNQGGKLYITDLAYDFAEQAFPEYIDFFGSGDVSETEREWMSEAHVGNRGITSEVTVNEGQLAAWLDNVSCQGLPCRNQDGTVHITGFLSGWAVMEGVHTGMTANAKVWTQGPVEWSEVSAGTKPLTISFNHGSGRVLYTSYHTMDETPSSDFWPQERILQYLIFEL